LRAIPNKIGGVVAMLLSILIFFRVPLTDKYILHNTKILLIRNILFICFVVNLILLGLLGSAVAEQPYIFISMVCTFLYFTLIILNFNLFKKN
jgi:ubiquinol-cytochrome c reductase cytochrome b subunit